MWWISFLICAQAPSFTLTSVEGEKVILDSLLKKGPVVIDFWGTWCKPCIKSLDTFNEIMEDFENVTFLGINENSPYSYNEAKAIVKLHKWNFPVLFDENKKVMEALQVKTIPHAFIIGRGREILYQHVGYKKGDEEGIIKKLSELSKDTVTVKDTTAMPKATCPGH